MLGKVTRRKVPKPGRAQRGRGFFLVAALVLHQRDQFARHKGKGDEDGRQHDARQGEQDVDVMVRPAIGPNQPCMPNTST